eukprot:7588930-Pyramimonas_sp.AAC.1
MAGAGLKKMGAHKGLNSAAAAARRIGASQRMRSVQMALQQQCARVWDAQRAQSVAHCQDNEARARGLR